MQRFFTLTEANRILPAVARRADRALRLQVLLRRLLFELDAEGLDVSPALLAGELGEHHAGLPALEHARAVCETLEDELDELEALGVQIECLEDGLVDFPSYLDGEIEVRLCWRLGEPSVSTYHVPTGDRDLGKPVAGRDFTASRRRRPPARS